MKSLTMIGVALMAGAAQADTAFDNFQPVDTFNCCTGWTITGAHSIVGVDYDQGEQFTALADGTINFIDIGIGNVTGTNNFFLDLYDDVGGQPGNILASWSGGPMPQFGTVSNQPIHIVNNDPHAALTAGQTYWLIASAPDDTWNAWNWNSIGDVGGHAFRDSNGPWQISGNTRGAFRIDVSRVPAPGTGVLIGLAGLAAQRRRR